MIDPLDHPVWSALSTRHARFAQGTLARRYDPGLLPFAAAGSDDPDSLAALAALLPSDRDSILAKVGPVALPPGARLVGEARAVQMVATVRHRPVEDQEIEPLGPADAAEMLALAELTRPGPFSLRALELGAFWGIRSQGRLVAMAGERMSLDGFTEVSGVCSHPQMRGKGLARRLTLAVAGLIAARGDTPFLHAYAGNESAVGLYRSIGFATRCELAIAVVRGGAPPADL